MKTVNDIVMRENEKSETHFQGHWLTTPRLIWIVAVVLYMGVYALSYPLYIQQTFANFPVSPPGTRTATARDEVDMDRLVNALVGVVEETVQPEHVSIWLIGESVER